MKVNLTGVLVKGIILLILLGLIVLGFGAYVSWKEYQAFMANERQKNFVQVQTIKGDLLKGSLEKMPNGELMLTHRGVRVFFQPNEIAGTTPLPEEEKETLIQDASIRHIKEKLNDFSLFFKEGLSESDQYITPEPQ